MNYSDIAKEIEKLLCYALEHELIGQMDVIPTRNTLINLLKVTEPFDGNFTFHHIDSLSGILANLLDYAVENEIIVNNASSRDLFDTKIMGLLMPRQSEVVNNFYYRLESQGREKATEYLYDLSKVSNYIRMDRISKNLHWLVATSYGDLELTVNLSRPEKDQRELEVSKLIPQFKYPKCSLCIENVGYCGDICHPARQNLRVIPIKILDEQWYFQYSPYVYYNEHCILFSEKHAPMTILNKTFERLIEFVDQFPHYFLGSNSDLSIVGGSILNHEHYQGGKYIFPLEKAPIELYFYNPHYLSIKTGIVKWPMSVIRLSGKNKNELVSLASHIFQKWRDYNDNELNIVAFTIAEEQKSHHNTITPIARKNSYGEFEIDLVLRNNRTDKEHPHGIFHSSKELHHIKKENIGLIESMGLAVLPGSLEGELKVIEDILVGITDYKSIYGNINSPLYKHLPWIDYLIKKYKLNYKVNEARFIIQKEVGYKFLNMLIDAGVYKRNTKGIQGFSRFMQYAGFEQ